MKIFEKIIFWLFGILLFLVPLILWPYTSEVFEFNKIVLTYSLTALITGAWLIRMIYEKKFVFRRTILDIPLLVFLGSQIISTLISIDPLTSWLGYYSRFNGGLLSIISYCLLYWAFVSNIDSKKTIKLINVTLVSTALLSIYGVLEHFGIDKNVWVQDVQSRVFSTIGQPNWLAAWLVTLMPIVWTFTLKSNIKSKSFWIYFSLSVLFFWTLIFTKSRSGFAGFGVIFILFWIGYFWTKRKQIKESFAPWAIIVSSFLIVSLISGTQWTPSINALITKSTNKQIVTGQVGATSLETGGTESGSIRKIVWKGALQVWLHYPIFGAGNETFAYSYYMYRPAAHNSTSEWDFIYNKAHNEYLNFLANSGIVGLLAYLTLIGFSIYQMVNLKTQNLKPDKTSDLRFAILTGYTSLLVTNFFGFSVVPTQLQFFLFPAFAITLTESGIRNQESGIKRITQFQKTAIFLIIILTSYFIIQIANYWYADYLYAMGKGYNAANKPDVASNYLTQAISIEPNQPVYHSDLASSYARIAVALNQQGKTDQVKQFSDMAGAEIDKAISLSPANVNLKRVKFAVFVTLSTINPNYLINARDTLISAVVQAPTDAKLFYNLGLVYARTGQMGLARESLKKTIELKPEYKDARMAYAYLLIDAKQNAEAKAQLEYILKYINPNDSLSKQTLESIK